MEVPSADNAAADVDATVDRCAAVPAWTVDRRRFVFCCDVSDWAAADLEMVDTLARLQLLCSRVGGSLELRGASAELRQLLRLAGLDGVLPIEGVH
ncbi:MAG: hypothetical protein JWN95_3252 [Frankiales bacterium]|nr:hypothetical protein [Frankiales bacterium]